MESRPNGSNSMEAWSSGAGTEEKEGEGAGSGGGILLRL